jgi:hypothetical protein
MKELGTTSSDYAEAYTGMPNGSAAIERNDEPQAVAWPYDSTRCYETARYYGIPMIAPIWRTIFVTSSFI